MNKINLLNALRMGNVPQNDISNLCVSREAEINEFKNILSDVSNSQSFVKFLNGEYGAGKSFLLNIIEELALENNFAVSRISVLTDSTIESIYSDVMCSLRSLNEISLKQIIDNWLGKFNNIFIDDDDMSFFIQFLDNELHNAVKFSNEFIRAIENYYKFKYSNEINKSSSIISWLCGESQSSFLNDYCGNANKFKLLQALSYFLKYVGYSGLIILVDDMDNVLGIDSNERNDIYTYLKYICDYCNLNKFESSFFVFAGTPEFFEHHQKGIPYYEALDDMLKNVLDTDLPNVRKPILNLKGFKRNNLEKMANKLMLLHGEAYNWDAINKINPVLNDIISIYLDDAILTGGYVTPRVFIRSFISVLDTVQQNQSYFTDSQNIIKLFQYKNNHEMNEGIIEDNVEYDEDW